MGCLGNLTGAKVAERENQKALDELKAVLSPTGPAAQATQNVGQVPFDLTSLLSNASVSNGQTQPAPSSSSLSPVGTSALGGEAMLA